MKSSWVSRLQSRLGSWPTWLVVLSAGAGFMVGGAVGATGLFSATTAAWVQALLTVAAVYAASRLQERFVTTRERASRTAKLEAIASIARHCWDIYKRTLERTTPMGMDSQAYLGVFRSAEFETAINELNGIGVIELDDNPLVYAVINLKSHMQSTKAELESSRSQIAAAVERGAANPIGARGIVEIHKTDIYNAAASVERRVAQLVKREDRMPTP